MQRCFVALKWVDLKRSSRGLLTFQYWHGLCAYCVVYHASNTCNCAKLVVVGLDHAHCALPPAPPPIWFEISSTYTHATDMHREIERGSVLKGEKEGEVLVRISVFQCGEKRRGRCRLRCQTMFYVTNRFQFDIDKSLCKYRRINYLYHY